MEDMINLSFRCKPKESTKLSLYHLKTSATKNAGANQRHE